MEIEANLQVLAQTIYGEARNQNFAGMLAVGYVVMNRTYRLRLSVAAVCQQPLQFSCWNEDDPNRKVIENVRPDSTVFIECLAAAAIAITRALPDPTGGATNYHTVEAPKSAKSWPPYWAKSPSMVPTTLFGDHQFYRED